MTSTGVSQVSQLLQDFKTAKQEVDKAHSACHAASDAIITAILGAIQRALPIGTGLIAEYRDYGVLVEKRGKFLVGIHADRSICHNPKVWVGKTEISLDDPDALDQVREAIREKKVPCDIIR